MPRPKFLKARFALKFAAGTLAAAFGLTGLGGLTAEFFRPDLTRHVERPTDHAANAARQARNPRLTPDHPPVIVREVNYAEGSKGNWWPRGEAPILADLVQQGVLPPVAERTGREHRGLDRASRTQCAALCDQCYHRF